MDQRPLVGRYELISRVGSGGMAEVFRARAQGIEGFEKTVVLKRVRQELASQPLLREQLVAEAKLASGLEHPNIAQTFDLIAEGESLYIVMEYVRGADVLALLRRCTAARVRVPVGVAVTIAIEVAKALAYAHAVTDPDGNPSGIVHCDVSPSNILVSMEGGVKLVDFGVARATAFHDQRPSGGFRGKVGYMAPEVLLTGHADARSDIFALGTVLWEMLTLRRLFRRPSQIDTLRSVVDGDVEQRFARHNYLDPTLQAIVRRAVNKDPERRYQTARELLDDLLDFVFESRLRVTEHDVAAFLAEVFPTPWEEALPPLQLAVEPPPIPSGAPKEDAPDDDLLSGLAIGDLVALVDALGTTSDDDETTPEGLAAILDEHEEEIAAAVEEGSSSPIQPDLPIFPSLEELVVGEAHGLDTGWDSWLRPDADPAAAVIAAIDGARSSFRARFDRRTILAFVARLAVDRVTGTAVCARPGHLKRVHVRDGRIVHITTNASGELLGHHLRDEGFITRGQQARGVALGRERGLKLGAALRQINAVTEAQLRHTLRHQVEARLGDLAQWTEGEVTWESGDLVPQIEDADGIDPLLVIGHLARTRFTHDEIVAWLSPFAEMRLTRRRGIPLDEVGLTEVELRAIRALVPGVRISEVLRRATEQNTLARAMWILIQTYNGRLYA